MNDARQARLEAWERDRTLLRPGRLRERLEALDRLEADLLHEDATPAEAALHARARALRARFEQVDEALYDALRREIRQGRRPALLLEQLAGAGRDGVAGGDGYDYRDELLAGVLRLEEPAAAPAALAPGMVFYQPTPARHGFGLLARAGLGARDVLVDLGSGLGHVPLLAAICTDAAAVGIEQEAAYVDCARRAARALGLANASFLHGDARDADFSVGTLFYLYTPFRGTMLRSVLDALRREAAARAIRVAAFGPCTPLVAAEPWLAPEGAVVADRVALFRSR
ncbi:methyltransferase domain-containing protein [Fulvimonas soli]|uniref:Methyltransferase family protein n=1 Tax=Fulvimonas soli TaxID=155197 RepID=A0A316IGF5_9GAMM|nr:methyltransferase domain-containing protein [Fulvimonas soli]PWK92592.1 methyltransferase family protein [Fulvimonas soli]TNY27797.1 hypothetical protein BV497_01920 [Fulvimonas soli]